MSILSEISTSLQQGRAKAVKELVQKALDESLSVRSILDEGLLDGMGIIGDKFKNNEIFVPEVMLAARAMSAGSEVLKPLLAASDIKNRGTVVLGTVKGDQHDIGKNLVKMMMEGRGLEVIDLGTDVSAEKFIAAAKEKGAQIIACSALLTTTMGEMKKVVQQLATEDLRDKFTVMVGGAPVTEQYCRSIGADIYTPDAASAAEAAAEACSRN